MGKNSMNNLIGMGESTKPTEGKSQWTKGGVKQIDSKEERLRKAREKIDEEQQRKSILKKDGTFKNGVLAGPRSVPFYLVCAAFRPIFSAGGASLHNLALLARGSVEPSDRELIFPTCLAGLALSTR